MTYFVQDGDIDKLLSWFNHSGAEWEYKPRFLCLYLGSTVDSRDFLAGILQQLPLINEKLTHDIGFFFFGASSVNCALETERWSVNPRNYHELGFTPKTIRTSQSKLAMNVVLSSSELTEGRSQYVDGTISMAGKNASALNIPKSALPCIVLIQRGGVNDPWVIPTSGQETLEQFMLFLDELQKTLDLEKPSHRTANDALREFFREFSSIENLILRATNNRKHNAELSVELSDALGALQESRSSFDEALTSAGVPPDARRELLEAAADTKKIWMLLGVDRQRPQPQHMNSLGELFDTVLQQQESKSLIRSIQSSFKKVISLQKGVEKTEKFEKLLRHHIQVLKNKAEAAKLAEAETQERIEETEKLISDLCTRFENRFNRRAAVKPLLGFARMFLRTANTANTALNVVEVAERALPD